VTHKRNLFLDYSLGVFARDKRYGTAYRQKRFVADIWFFITDIITDKLSTPMISSRYR
jgi:hypothetical protein